MILKTMPKVPRTEALDVYKRQDLTSHADLSSVRDQEAAEKIEQDRLSTPVSPDYANSTPLFHIQGNAGQNAPSGKALAYLF